MTEIQQLQNRLAQGVDDYPKDHLVDHVLIEDYLAGDERAGMRLVHNYLDVLAYIYRYPFKPPNRGKALKFAIKKPSMSREDREDLVQEILYNFFKLVTEFDPERGKPFEALVKGTLHHRVYRNFFDEFLLKARNEEVFEDDYTEVGINDVTSSLFLEENSQSREKYIALYEALNSLNKRQREVVLLSVVNGWTCREVAEEIGSTSSSVRNAKSFGMRKLRDTLGGTK